MGAFEMAGHVKNNLELDTIISNSANEGINTDKGHMCASPRLTNR